MSVTSKRRRLRPRKGRPDAESVTFALALVEEFDALDEAGMKALTQDEMDLLYDWAMRVYMRASDNGYVRVPDRPVELLARLGVSGATR